jgi:hypothetical protein
MNAERKRINDLAAALSYGPIPGDSTDWLHEPSLLLLTEEESDGLVEVFEKLEGIASDSPMLPLAMDRLNNNDLDLLEVFIRKSEQGLARKKVSGFPTVLQMNIADDARQS